MIKDRERHIQLLLRCEMKPLSTVLWYLVRGRIKLKPRMKILMPWFGSQYVYLNRELHPGLRKSAPNGRIEYKSEPQVLNYMSRNW